MQCKDVSEKLPDYLARSLDEATRASLERHLGGCAACLGQVEGLTATWSTLGALPGAAPDSPTMRARLDAMIEHEQANQSRFVKSGFQWNNPWLAACAASAVLAVGVLLGRATDNQPAASPGVAALHAELRDLRQMVTLSLMQQQSASERLRGVSFSNQVDGSGDEIVTALLDTLKHDNNVNVRLASVDALKRFAERDVVRRATIDALDSQTSPLVQMALIDFVVETQDLGALNALRKLSEDASNETVRTRAAWGMQHLGVQS